MCGRIVSGYESFKSSGNGEGSQRMRGNINRRSEVCVVENVWPGITGRDRMGCTGTSDRSRGLVMRTVVEVWHIMHCPAWQNEIFCSQWCSW